MARYCFRSYGRSLWLLQWRVDCLEGQGRSRKIDWGPAAITARDVSGLDCGGDNEDGRMTPHLDVFCRRAEDLLSSWMWGVRECVEWRMTPKCSVWSRKENAAAVAWAWHDFRCSDMGSKIRSLDLNVLFWKCLLDIRWGSWGLRWKCESGVPERVGLEIPPWEMSAYGWYLRSNKGLRHSKRHNQCRTASHPHRVGKVNNSFWY